MDYEKGKKLEEAERKLTDIAEFTWGNDYKPMVEDPKIVSKILDVIDIIREVLGKNK